MTALMLRLYRCFTNPCPGPGQAWRLDGVGPVIVRAVRWDSSPVTVELGLPNGDSLNGWLLSQFRCQAILSQRRTGPQLCVGDLKLVEPGT